MSIKVELLAASFSPTEKEAVFRKTVNNAGAIVTFHGIMRPASKSGEVLDRMVLEWHPTLTLASMNEIAQSALSKFDIQSGYIAHRCGAILPNETIVFVAIASAHRREAFQAVDYIMDRLKMDAVLWKREEGPGYRAWIEPTTHDQHDRKRWT